MWESLFKHPRGRLSTRNYFSIATAFLVVCFAYIVASAPTTHAADARWNNDAIVYQQNNYRKDSQVSVGNESHGIAAGAIIYKYIETAGSGNGGSTQKAHLIYFPSGTDPATATSAKYQTFTLNNLGRYSNPSQVRDISLETSAVPGSTNPGTSSCVIEGIGWMVCPVTNFLASGMDKLYGYISNFLKVEPLSTTQDQALYRAWSYMRTFANVAFIIAFLVIIYSQITNAGLSNYDIKKMLPKIVIAAILVNTSYWICAIAVDLFNILGYSVQDLFILIRNSLVGSEGNEWDVISWESMTAAVLSGGTIIGGASIATYLGITGGSLAIGGATAGVTSAAGIAAGVFSGLIYILLPLLISVLFVVLITFIILAARQAIIVVLIVIAPLAFVAFLLPNTEKWFEKWRSTFLTLLLLFPAFSLVFGGAQLAAAAIIMAATSSESDIDIALILLAMGVQVAPLAIMPLLLKLGGGVLNRFAGIVNNPTKGVFDRGKNWAKERTDQNKAAGLARFDKRAQERGFVNGRPNGKNKFTRGVKRLHPYNMAYNREYDRRRRAGLKSANEAMSEGLFTNTTAGRTIHDLNKDAALEKHTGEAANARAYQQQLTKGTTQYDTYRRSLHHKAHEDEGIAKMHEDELHAEGEEHLREAILKSPRLVNIAKRTNELNKRAEQAKSIVDDQANIHWEELSLQDKKVYTRQLDRQGYAKQVKDAEAKWESILVEAAAGHTNDYEGKFGTVTPDLTAAIKRIKVADESIAVEGLRKSSAEFVVKTKLNEALKSNDILLDRAAGIDENGGRTKVVAKLTNESSGLYMENVKAVNSVFSNEGYSLDELKEVVFRGGLRGGEKATSMHRHAAIQQILLDKGNNWAAQEIEDFTASLGMSQQKDANGNIVKDSDGNTVFMDNFGNVLSNKEVEERRNLQQITNDARKSSKLKVDWVSGTDRGNSEVGMYMSTDPTRTQSEQAIIRDIRTGKIDGDRVFGADPDVISRQIQALRDPAIRDEIGDEAINQYLTTIKKVLNDPQRGHLLDARKRGGYHVIMSYLDSADTRSDVDKHSRYVDVTTNESIEILPENNMLNRQYAFKPPTGPISLSGE